MNNCKHMRQQEKKIPATKNERQKERERKSGKRKRAKITKAEKKNKRSIRGVLNGDNKSFGRLITT